jgi:AmiR/NasT family two-component response regulator
MSGKVIKNFRGLRTRVILPDDNNRARLVVMLQELGLEVTTILPGHAAAEAPGDFDLMFFDADEGLKHTLGYAAPSDLVRIALVGSEAPSRLAQVVGQRAASHILKPVRSAGVYTAVFLAVNEVRHRRREQRQIEVLRRRLAGRRAVTHAVVHMMRLCGIDEDAAYRWLRDEAMRRRIPIEEMAGESLGLDKHAQETLRQARISQTR